MLTYFLFDSLYVAVGRLRPAAFAEVPELVDLALGPHGICAGPALAEEVERRFVFHRISVVYGKQCLSIDSLCTCGHRFLPKNIFLSPLSLSWGVP